MANKKLCTLCENNVFNKVHAGLEGYKKEDSESICRLHNVLVEYFALKFRLEDPVFIEKISKIVNILSGEEAPTLNIPESVAPAPSSMPLLDFIDSTLTAPVAPVAPAAPVAPVAPKPGPAGWTKIPESERCRRCGLPATHCMCQQSKVPPPEAPKRHFYQCALCLGRFEAVGGCTPTACPKPGCGHPGLFFVDGLLDTPRKSKRTSPATEPPQAVSVPETPAATLSQEAEETRAQGPQEANAPPPKRKRGRPKGSGRKKAEPAVKPAAPRVVESDPADDTSDADLPRPRPASEAPPAQLPTGDDWFPPTAPKPVTYSETDDWFAMAAPSPSLPTVVLPEPPPFVGPEVDPKHLDRRGLLKWFSDLRPSPITLERVDDSEDFLTSSLECDNESCRGDRIIVRIPMHPTGGFNCQYLCLDCGSRYKIDLDAAEINEIAKGSPVDYLAMEQELRKINAPSIRPKPKKGEIKTTEKVDPKSYTVLAFPANGETYFPETPPIGECGIDNYLKHYETTETSQKIVDETLGESYLPIDPDIVIAEMQELMANWEDSRLISEWERVTQLSHVGTEVGAEQRAEMRVTVARAYAGQSVSGEGR